MLRISIISGISTHSALSRARFPKKKTYSWWCILGDTEAKFGQSGSGFSEVEVRRKLETPNPEHKALHPHKVGK